MFSRFMRRYVDQVLELTTREVSVRRRFIQVQGMLKPPSTLFHPAILARVILNAIGERFRKAKNEVIEVEDAPRLRERASSSKF